MDDDWNPMKDDFQSISFNSYNKGIGATLGLKHHPTAGSELSETKLYITGIPLSFQKTTLINTFSPYGEVMEAKIFQPKEDRKSCFGFIKYGSNAECQLAITHLHLQPPDNLYIQFALSKLDKIRDEKLKQAELKAQEEEIIRKSVFNQSRQSRKTEYVEDQRRLTMVIANASSAHSRNSAEPKTDLNMADVVDTGLIIRNGSRGRGHGYSGDLSDTELSNLYRESYPQGSIVNNSIVIQNLPTEPCNYCGQQAGVYRCLNCKVWYCNQTCQTNDWLRHKILCFLSENQNHLCDKAFGPKIGTTSVNKSTVPPKEPIPPREEVTTKKPELRRAYTQKPSEVFDQANTKTQPASQRSPVMTSYDQPKAVLVLAKECSVAAPLKPSVISEPLQTFKVETHVTVVSVDSPHHFWVQNSQELGPLEEITYQMLSAEKFTKLTQFQKGALCAAQFTEDNAWYRAKIEDIQGNGKCTVLFIDFGNSEQTTLSRLRSISAEALKFQAQAFQCKFLRIKPISNAWTEENNETLRTLVKDWPCIVKEVIEIKETPNSQQFWAVQLVDYEGQDIAELMISLNHGAVDISTRIVQNIPVPAVATSNQNQKPPMRSPPKPNTPTQAPPKQARTPIETAPKAITPTQSRPAKPRTPIETPPPKQRTPTQAPPPKTRTPPQASHQPELEFKLSSEYLQKGEKFTAHIVWMYSTKEFYITKQSDSDKVDVMMRKLAIGLKRANCFNYPPKRGQILAAQFPEDNEWYRAIVLNSKDKNDIEVEFIDYGNRCSIQSKSFLQLPRQFYEYPAFAYCVQLEGLDLNDNQMKELMDNVWSVTVEKEDASTSENKCPSIVNLFLNNVSVKDIYNKPKSAPVVKPETNYTVNHTTPTTISIKSPPPAVQPPVTAEITPSVASIGQVIRTVPKTYSEMPYATLTIGQKISVSVLSVINPDIIWIMNMDENTATDFVQLSTDINTFCQSQKPIPNFKPETGDLVLAKFKEDGVWYRAAILNINDGEYIVIFLDFGNMESMEANEMFPIPNHFLDIPSQAVQCCLFGIEPQLDWSPEITSVMNAIIDENEKQMEIKVESLDEANFLYCVDMPKVTEQLLTKKLVKPAIVFQVEQPKEVIDPAKQALKDQIEALQSALAQMDK